MSATGDRPDRCLICGHTAFSEIAPNVRDSESHRVVQCGACGHRQLSPMPTAADDAAFYEADRQQANIGQVVDLNTAHALLSDDTHRRVAFVAARAGGGRLLDIGAGYGFFLAGAAEKGFDAAGIEVSSERIATARQITHAPIHQIDLVDSGHTLGAFDVVTMFHVVEHLTEPIRFLDAARRLLKPGGMVFVEVPNAADLMLESSAAYRAFWWQRAHVSYFSAESLTAAVARAGFDDVEILAIQRYGIENMMHWLQHGGPQLSAPSYHTQGPYRWLEDHYKTFLENSRRSDTLMAVAHRRG